MKRMLCSSESAEAMTTRTRTRKTVARPSLGLAATPCANESAFESDPPRKQGTEQAVRAGPGVTPGTSLPIAGTIEPIDGEGPRRTTENCASPRQRGGHKVGVPVCRSVSRQ